LIIDIMKYGADCTVVEPAALRQRVTDELAASLKSCRIGQVHLLRPRTRSRQSRPATKTRWPANTFRQHPR